MSLNNRERLLASINGQEVFPVPTDVIENMIYPSLEKSLMQKTGVSSREQLLRALNSHIRWGHVKYIGPPLEKSPIQPVDPFPNKFAFKNIWGSYSGLNTYSDEFAPRPFANVTSIRQIHEYKWPDPKWFDYRLIGPPMAEQSDYLSVDKWTASHVDCAHLIGGYDPIFGRVCDLCGIESTLMNLAANLQIIQAIVEHITDFLEQYYEGIAKACKGYIDILAFGDDFASQNGMMFSPQQWREIFKPCWKRLFAVAHKYGMKAQMHSCGSIRPVLRDLIEAGLDIFEVVQIRAVDMDPNELKMEYGKDLTFFGTVDVQEVLPTYSPQQVCDEVRRLIDCFGRGGKFILANSHILMEDIPADNVIAMFDEAKRYIPLNCS